MSSPFTGIYRYVGIERPYSTIQSAVDDSSNGDVVIIDHGVYVESVYINDKFVHLKGATPFPEDGGVRIVTVNDTPPLRISLEGMTGTLLLEGLHLETTYGNWQRALEIDTDADNSSVHIIVNKSRMIALGKKFCVGIGPNPQFNLGSLTLTNCYLERGYSHSVYFNYINSTSVTATECNNPFEAWEGDPDVEDTVYIPTSGYGPAYGDWLIPQDLYYFKGYVLENGNPIERKVRAIRDSGVTLPPGTTYSGGGVYHTGSAMSYNQFDHIISSSAHPLGQFVIISNFPGPHDIIAYDDTAGLDYNDLIVAGVSPINFS